MSLVSLKQLENGNILNRFVYNEQNHQYVTEATVYAYLADSSGNEVVPDTTKYIYLGYNGYVLGDETSDDNGKTWKYEYTGTDQIYYMVPIDTYHQNDDKEKYNGYIDYATIKLKAVAKADSFVITDNKFTDTNLKITNGYVLKLDSDTIKSVTKSSTGYTINDFSPCYNVKTAYSQYVFSQNNGGDSNIIVGSIHESGGKNNIVVAENAYKVTGDENVALGEFSGGVIGDKNVAINAQGPVYGDSNLAINSWCVYGDNNVALNGAYVGGNNSIGIGHDVYTTANNVVSLIGSARNDGDVAIGYGALVQSYPNRNTPGVGIGNGARADGGGVAIGAQAQAWGTTVLDTDGKTVKYYDASTAVGFHASCGGSYNGTAIGGVAQAGEKSTAVGARTTANAPESIAVGYNIGTAPYSVLVGNNYTGGYRTTSIGYHDESTGDASISSNTNVGYNARSAYNSVAIGCLSDATDEPYTVSFGTTKEVDDVYDETTKTSTKKPIYRRVINIADGKNDHDAVTKAQMTTSIATATKYANVKKYNIQKFAISGDTAVTEFTISNKPENTEYAPLYDADTEMIQIVINHNVYDQDEDFTFDKATNKITWIATAANGGFDLTKDLCDSIKVKYAYTYTA